MKDALSSVDIAVVTLELADKIVGQRLDNIYHIIPKTFIIRLRPDNLRLLVEIERRIHLTRFDYPIPQKPSNFCMALRKYLVDGTIQTVEQHEFDRVVTLTISTGEGKFLLVAEVFRRGNLIVVDPENRVRLSLRYARMRDRDVIRNEPYRPAPLSGLNPLSMQSDELEAIKKTGDTTCLKALMSLVSLGPLYAEEILLHSGIDNKLPAKDLNETQVKGIARSLVILKRRIIEREFEPAIITDDKSNPIDAIPFPLKIYEGKTFTQFKTYNEVVDEFFSTQATTIELEKVQTVQKEEEARLRRVSKEQAEQRILLQETIKTNRERGDIIYQHFHTITRLMQAIYKARDKESNIKELNQVVSREIPGLESEVTFEILLDEVKLSIEGVALQIRLDKSPQQVAKEYYAAAKKAVQKLKGLEQSTSEIESKIQDLSSRAALRKAQAKIPTPIRERAWYEKFHWFKSSDGFLVLAGKDASTNDLLIRRHLQRNDLVFHAEIHGAPFTIIKTEDKVVPESTLSEAAQAAASRSKAWSLNLSSVDVYWVSAQQVGTKAPSGEYLGRGQFMMTGKRNYIRGIELKMAIGVEQEAEEGEIRLIAGPPSTIKKQSTAYVEVVPGRTSSGRLAKSIIEILKNSSPEFIRDKLNRLPPDEAARLIPAGRGDIVYRGRIFPKIL